MKKQTVMRFNISVFGVESAIQKHMAKNNCYVVSAVPVTNKHGITDYIVVVFEQNA